MADTRLTQEHVARALGMSSEARAQYLESLRQSDERLATDVEATLAATERAELPTAPPMDPRASGSMGYTSGDKIGRYELLAKLGSGGFGVVWRARQSEPVRRDVALKLIKPGMDSSAVLSRFGAERQALALMDHTCIARVFDGGATERGLPFFAMELVKGVPITEHCDRHKLSLEERLRLFRRVCDAVQHAHSKGVIHRDLKPSNILVEYEGGQSMPKVIDFGVAKALDSRLTEDTIFTEQGQMIGTPEYMSPEQAEMSAQDIDTRSDIYSLGVVLYELLTGARPFEAAALRYAGLAEIQRIIREVQPQKPSTRLASLASSASDPDAGTRVAEARRTELRSLTGTLRRDLDWVVMKCLEKERSRRYETANALSMELQRFLGNEPVLAGPPSVTYRLSKFVRRNRPGVAAAGVAVGALVVATAVSVSFAILAEQRRDRAVLAEQTAENRSEQLAVALNAEQERTRQLDEVARFQAEQLAAADFNAMGVTIREGLRAGVGTTAQRRELPADEIDEVLASLDGLIAGADFTGIALQVVSRHVFTESLEAIDRGFDDQPLVKARLLHTMVKTMHEAGLTEDAVEPQREALEIRERLLGPNHPDTLQSLETTGILLYSQGEFEEARRYTERAAEGLRAQLGPTHRQTLHAIASAGALEHMQGNLEAAATLYLEVLEAREESLGSDHPDTLSSFNGYGSVLLSMSRVEEAEEYFRRALEGRRRVLGDDDPKTLITIDYLGSLLQFMNRLEEAEALLSEGLESRRSVFGDQHPHTIGSMNNLAMLYRLRGKFAPAEALFREAVERSIEVLGPRHPDTLKPMANVAVVLASTGKLDAAETAFRDLQDAFRDVNGPAHPNTLLASNNLARLLSMRQMHAEAETVLAETLQLARQSLGASHAITMDSCELLGSALLAQDKLAEAEPLLRESLQTQAEILGEEHPKTLRSMQSVASLFRLREDLDEAESMLLRLMEISERVKGPEDQTTLNAMFALTQIEEARGDVASAQTVGSEMVARARRSPGLAEWALGSYIVRGAELLMLSQDHEQVERLLLEAHALLTGQLGETDQRVQECIAQVVGLYDSWHEASPDQGHDETASSWRSRLQDPGEGGPAGDGG